MMDNDTQVLDNQTQTPTPATTQAPAEPPSLRESLEAAVKQADTPTEQTQQTTQTRQRDEQGRFIGKNADGSQVPSEDQVKAAQQSQRLSLDPDADDGEEEPPPKDDPMPSVDNPPRSWKQVAKEKWANVDPVVRAEVHRREREATRMVQEHAPVKQFATQFTETIKPYAQHYSQTGLQPLQLFNNLMQADVHLSTAPPPQRAAFMAKLIKDYGIDIQMLDSALAGNDPTNGPHAGIERLLDERLAPVNQFLQQQQSRQQQTVQAERQRANTVLNRMAADTVNFPHFDMVAQDMADITEMALKRQVYLTPEEAYKRAVAMNPEAQAAEQSRTGRQRAQDAHNAATRSLGASLSVNGSPASLPQSVNPDDLRGTIEAAWAAAQGR